MITRTADAVVVGAGPNGLVAAIALADAGWDVVLVEAADRVGGAVATAEVTAPGYRTDLFSAFYPLAAASPVIRDLGLDAHGLRWRRAPAVLAHALDDGGAAVLEADAEATATALDVARPGDGAAWLDLVDGWRRVSDDVLAALFTPFPPVASLARLLRRAGARGALDLARLAVLPVRRLGTEHFRGDGAALLLTGNAMHADIPPDAAGSGLLGWLLTMLGQDVGYPTPEGGAGRLADALLARFRAAGGQVLTGTTVTAVAVAGGRAVGVLTA
ncbi:MAG TPA: NAD(P)/FAD-dependent oxidoreductase, partial [Actinomycetospora sp.]|nr:NAD(P)/FAD-dependent oxidoreductase [Actinomycetospora sp.]